VFPTNVLKSGVLFDAGKKNLRVPKYWQPVFFLLPKPAIRLERSSFCEAQRSKKAGVEGGKIALKNLLVFL